MLLTDVEKKQFQSGEEAVAARDAHFVSLMFLIEPNCLFVIFKARPNSSIASNLHPILPFGMHSCVQEKGWVNNRVMSIWKDKVWYPYIQGTSKSALLLDAIGNHIQNDFIDAVDEQGKQVIQIPGASYLCVSLVMLES